MMKIRLFLTLINFIRTLQNSFDDSMTAIILLIVCSMIVAGGFLVAFLKSVKNGQYDDTYTPSVRMLFDDATVERSADHVKSKEDSNTEINS